MANIDPNRSLQGYARLAGFMYLIILAFYISGDAITSAMHVSGDFAATAQNITESEHIYRAGLSGELISSLMTILLGGALYVVLKSVDANLALFALLWRVAEAVFGGMTAIIKFTSVKNYTDSTGILGSESREAVARLLSSAGGTSFYIAVIFFSIGSIVFFYLFFKSRLIPRMLSCFGIIASFTVPMLAFSNLIIPGFSSALNYGWALIFIAEIGTGLWLLIRGVEVAALPGSAASPTSSQ